MKIKVLRRCLFGWRTLVLLPVLQPFGVLAQNPPEQQAVSTPASIRQNQHCIKAEVLFPVGAGYLDLNFQDNRVNLLRFLVKLNEITSDTTYIIKGIEVAGSCSPEGNSERNLQLASERATSLRNYLVEDGKIPAAKIKIVSLGENWPGLKVLVNDSDMPRKQAILSLMERYGDDYASLKNAVIRDQDGKTWDWMYGHFFPKLRKGAGEAGDITLSCDFTTTATATAKARNTQESAGKDTVSVQHTEKVSQHPKTQTTTDVVIENSIVRKPLFALKTNLLFDVASLLNIELEVPIGKRFSIAGEVIAPWWLWEDKQHCLQIMSGNLEGRYWFGNREQTRGGTPRHVMTGWFAGLYAGGGYYDLEWDKEGYQGEFFIAAGVSGGYAHTINKRGNLRMEYSIGVGYMQTDYREYQAKMGNDNQWHLYRQNDGKFSWFGPTRAKVSLVWMLNSNKRGGVR